MSRIIYYNGRVEKIYTHGKLGIINGMDGQRYFFNESSFDPTSIRKRLRVGEAVVFRCLYPVTTDGKYPVVFEMKTSDEVLKDFGL